ADRARSLPLPPQLSRAQVLLGGRALPLLFARDGQINAQVPYDLTANSQAQVVVVHGEEQSVPQSFTGADAQPGIFAKNAQGFGQGIVLHLDQVTYAEPGTPASRGEVVVIYCAGLGLVDANVQSGQAAPFDPPARTVSGVGLTIGGRPAQVLF